MVKLSIKISKNRKNPEKSLKNGEIITENTKKGRKILKNAEIINENLEKSLQIINYRKCEERAKNH